MSKIENKSLILSKYNIAQTDLLGSGMEAEAYAYEKDKVLKLYNNMSDYKKQTILKRFYHSLDTKGISYNFPCIHDIMEENGTLITIEKRIDGRSLESQFINMDNKQLKNIMETYLAANIELQLVKINLPLEGYSLINDYEISVPKVNNWFDLLKEIYLKKKTELEVYFTKDVVNYQEKSKKLLDILSLGFKGDYSLIHGDFCPGNLLINNKGKITGLIDFGLLTMYGDYLYDVAIGWVCFDMYNTLKADIKERYLKLIVNTLGEKVRSRLYLYVLVYSSISANFYSKDCIDGHYQWCVENLNNKQYWNAL